MVGRVSSHRRPGAARRNRFANLPLVSAVRWRVKEGAPLLPSFCDEAAEAMDQRRGGRKNRTAAAPFGRQSDLGMASQFGIA